MQVTSIDDDDGASWKWYRVEQIYVVNLAGGNGQKYGD